MQKTQRNNKNKLKKICGNY